MHANYEILYICNLPSGLVDGIVSFWQLTVIACDRTTIRRQLTFVALSDLMIEELIKFGVWFPQVNGVSTRIVRSICFKDTDVVWYEKAANNFYFPWCWRNDWSPFNLIGAHRRSLTRRITHTLNIANLIENFTWHI